MTISVQRLTLFAIFSALEKDLRSILLSELLSYHNLDTVLTNNEISKISDRYKKYEDSPNIDMEDLQGLIQYLDLFDSVQILNRNRNKISPSLSAYISGITAILEKCVPIRNAVMHGRPLEIDDFPTICGIASKLASDSGYHWPYISDTLSEIENNSNYVFGLSFTIVDESASGAFHNLPTPDFDDTGFVGRKNILTKVKDAISGPFPVISLVGPGGVGKTALALKIAYELLGQENLEFEAIVWTSAKANTLTAKEIERIEGAIESSLGVFTSIIEEFEPNTSDDPESHLIDLLASFKVLLIIDNLETVLDDRLRQFIQKVPKGSKILLTSRIGVGAGDLSIEVPPLTMAESRIYFRKLVQSYEVQRLKNVNNETADRYIKRLVSNPLFLKWFVTAVKAGSMPEKLLSDQAEILKFCLENVVEHLDSNSKSICNAYLVIDGPHSLPMLAQLTEMQPVDIETALSNLITCNIITMIPINDLGDTAYQMSDLPRAYLRRISKMSVDAAEKITQRYRNVQSTIEQAAYFRGEDIYRFENFQIENRDQAIIVSELKKAFAAIRRKEFDKAEETISSVSGLAPGYFEIERVKAFLKFEAGDYVAAARAYEMAIELRPDYAPLHFWYGGFLLRAYDDLDAALEAFETASKLRPSVLVERERARVLLYKGMFDSAEEIVQRLLDNESLTNRHVAILTDLKIQCHCRKFEHRLDTGEFQAAVEVLLDAQRYGEDIPQNVFDNKMADRYRRILPKIEVLRTVFEGSVRERAVKDLLAWAKEFSERGVQKGRIGRCNPGPVESTIADLNESDKESYDEYVVGAVCEGVVVRVADSSTFAFIRTQNGHDFFFHQSAVSSRGECLYMGVGVPVYFTISVNAKGYCASDVKLLFRESLEEYVNSKERVRACVVSKRSGTDYGFAIIAHHGQMLIRREDFEKLEDWERLKEGDQIIADIETGDKGFLGKRMMIT